MVSYMYMLLCIYIVPLNTHPPNILFYGSILFIVSYQYEKIKTNLKFIAIHSQVVIAVYILHWIPL